MSTRKFESDYSKKKKRIETLIGQQKGVINKKEQCLGYWCIDISFLKEKCLNLKKSLKHDN